MIAGFSGQVRIARKSDESIKIGMLSFYEQLPEIILCLDPMVGHTRAVSVQLSPTNRPYKEFCLEKKVQSQNESGKCWDKVFIR